MSYKVHPECLFHLPAILPQFLSKTLDKIRIVSLKSPEVSKVNLVNRLIHITRESEWFVSSALPLIKAHANLPKKWRGIIIFGKTIGTSFSAITYSSENKCNGLHSDGGKPFTEYNAVICSLAKKKVLRTLKQS